MADVTETMTAISIMVQLQHVSSAVVCDAAMGISLWCLCILQIYSMALWPSGQICFAEQNTPLSKEFGPPLAFAIHRIYVNSRMALHRLTI